MMQLPSIAVQASVTAKVSYSYTIQRTSIYIYIILLVPASTYIHLKVRPRRIRAQARLSPPGFILDTLSNGLDFQINIRLNLYALTFPIRGSSLRPGFGVQFRLAAKTLDVYVRGALVHPLEAVWAVRAPGDGHS
jgi:hypothetical protein